MKDYSTGSHTRIRRAAIGAIGGVVFFVLWIASMEGLVAAISHFLGASFPLNLFEPPPWNEETSKWAITSATTSHLIEFLIATLASAAVTVAIFTRVTLLSQFQLLAIGMVMLILGYISGLFLVLAPRFIPVPLVHGTYIAGSLALPLVSCFILKKVNFWHPRLTREETSC